MEKEVTQKISEIGLIMSLDQPIEYIQMQHDLLKLSPPELVERYGWLNVYSPHDAPYTEKDFVKMKLEINEKEILKQLQNFSEVKKKFQELVDKIEDLELKQKTKAVHTYAFLKTDRIDSWKKAMAYLAPFYHYLALLIPGSKIQETVNLAAFEIEELLAEKSKLTLEELQLRSSGKVLYFYTPEQIEVIRDPKIINGTRTVLERGPTDLKEFSGFPACQGKVKGLVKIITHSQDLHKIQKGDIFVAKYTFPSYTPAMLKSAAIITDEGGITTHAAIISREFKIPCIIGTKIATKMLKDGDEIEVDANKGVVKLINHGKR